MATQPVESLGLDIESLIAFLRDEAAKSIDDSLNDERANAIDF